MRIVADWQEYERMTDTIEDLKKLRDWVEEHQWGFGDRALYYMWYQLLQDLPDESILAEIGVYKGQTLALWGIIGELINKDFIIAGVTPLTDTQDKYHKFEESDYAQDILTIHDAFLLPPPMIVHGYSTDKRTVNLTPEPLDLLYVDGGHDEATVYSDITNYVPKVRRGGYVVFDDASCYTDAPLDHWYRGLEEVSKVVDEFANNEDFEEQLIVGHNRVFKRLV